MKFLIFLLLIGCSTPPIKTGYADNYEDKTRKSVMECVRILKKDGFEELLIYPICSDMHLKKGNTQYNDRK